MGRIKDEMTNLAQEIGALHTARRAFRQEIRNRVTDLQSGVHELRAGYQSARQQMARTMRTESKAFLSGLRKTVAGLEHEAQGTRREFAADLAGALAAWSGRRESAAPSTRKARKAHKRAK